MKISKGYAIGLFFGLLCSCVGKPLKNDSQYVTTYPEANEMADTAAATVDAQLMMVSPNFGSGSDGRDFKLAPKSEDEEPQMPKKIIRNASLEIQVKNAENFIKIIEKELVQLNVYSVSSNMSRYGAEINQSIELKVPPENLDSLVSLLKSKSVYVRNFSTSSEDVTSNYYDSQARLRTKKELEKRYFEILKSAKKVSEILEVEEKLSEVRSEIESFEGQLKLYDHQVAYSNVSLSLYQLIPRQHQPGLSFGSRLVSGLGTGWHKLLASIISLTENWYWFLLITGAILWLRNWRRKRADGQSR